MNKSIALLIIGVISLAMFLIMLNQFATTSNPPPLVGVQSPLPQSGIPSSAALSPPNAPPMASSPVPAPKTPQTGVIAAQPAPVTASPPLPKPVLPSHSTTALDSPDTKTRPAPEHASPAPAGKSKTQAPVVENAPQTPPAPQVPAKPAPAKPAPAKPAAPKAIEKISVSAAGEGANVRINGNSTLAYKTMHLKEPDRLVVDLEGVWAIKAPGVPANKAVKNVRIGKQSSKTRIVIDLLHSPASVKFIKVSDEILEVRVR